MAFQKVALRKMTPAFPGDYYRLPVRSFGSNCAVPVTAGLGAFVSADATNYEQVKQSGSNGDVFVGFVVKNNTGILTDILSEGTNQFPAGSRVEICAQGAIWVTNNVAAPSGSSARAAATAKIGYKVAVEIATGLISTYDPNEIVPTGTVETDFVVIALGSDGSPGSLLVIANDQQLPKVGTTNAK